MSKDIFYFAYGSNLDYTRMLNRCKSARVYAKVELEGMRLCFMENNSRKIVANVEDCEGESVVGILYQIDIKDLYKLDGYEGYPRVYNRKIVNVDYRGRILEAVMYQMDKKCNIENKNYLYRFVRKYGVPKKDYFNHLLNGYNMFDLSQNKLREAYFYSKERGEGKV